MKPNIQTGDHVCSIYKNKDQQFEQVFGFLKNGLLENYQCAYVVDEYSAEDITTQFASGGFELGEYIRSGQFAFFTKHDCYLAGGTFVPERVIDLLKKMEHDAIAAGYAGLKATGEITWALDDKENIKKIVEYENKLNAFFSNSRSSAICQYNENKFDKDLLTEVIRSHPVLYIYENIYDNKYFYNPALFYNTASANILSSSYEVVKQIIIEDSDR